MVPFPEVRKQVRWEWVGGLGADGFLVGLADEGRITQHGIGAQQARLGRALHRVDVVLWVHKRQRGERSVWVSGR